MYVNKLASVAVNRKAYNDMREKKRASERDIDKQIETERDRDRQTDRQREDGFCFVFYCLDMNELRRRYTANMRTGVRTCVV